MSDTAGPVVSGCLGRIIGPDGMPVGTCFQVDTGVLVTACHVVAALDAARVDALVHVAQLDGGGSSGEARVVRVDPLHDLAVLRADAALRESCALLTASDQVLPTTAVLVTGWAQVADPGHVHEFLQSGGVWRGPVHRDGALCARVQAEAVLPGMSGAPVVRLDDLAVVGVVSGRYNSADGWLVGSVWVTRTEDLASLLAGVTSVGLHHRSTRQFAADHDEMAAERAHISKLIAIHERNTQILEDQLASFGPLYAPVHKQNELVHEQAELARLWARLEELR